MQNTMDSFLKRLRKQPHENVFNPWYESDSIHDKDKNGAKIRRRQLQQYLLERKKSAKYLLLAEAIGYQGGHFSGIPMTSERILLGKMRHKQIHPHHVFKDLVPVRTSKEIFKPDGFTEPTATIVWGHLIQSELNTRDFIFWNAFPWHPYKPQKGLLSNRTPTPTELQDGLLVLQELLKIHNFKKIIAVGEKSKEILDQAGIHSLKVRHPANGGATQFKDQLMKIL